MLLIYEAISNCILQVSRDHRDGWEIQVSNVTLSTIRYNGKRWWGS